VVLAQPSEELGLISHSGGEAEPGHITQAPIGPSGSDRPVGAAGHSAATDQRLPVEAALAEVEQLLTDARVSASRERQVVILLVTDVVSSSQTAASSGDVRRRRIVSAHRDAARCSLSRLGV
jgi:class 3 adenylate cyclase